MKKIAATILLIFIMLAPISTFAAETGFKQGDPRWASVRLGEQCTVADSGCLISSIADAMADAGYVDINPGNLAMELEEGGYISHDAYDIRLDGNLDYASAFSAPNQWGFNFTKTIDWTYTPYDEIKRNIHEELGQGNYVVVCVNHYGHYVCVSRDTTLEKVIIHDPGYAYTDLKDYDGTIMMGIVFTADSAHKAANVSSLPDGVMPVDLELVVTKDTNGGAALRTAGPGKEFEITGRAANGSKLHAVGSCKNKYDHLWFFTDDGSYVYSENVSILPSLKASNLSSPAEISKGDIFVLDGNLNSSVNTTLTACIRRSDGSVVCESSDSFTGNYMMKSSKLDKEMVFNRLERGNYTYTLSASQDADTGYSCVTVKTDLIKCNFTVM